MMRLGVGGVGWGGVRGPGEEVGLGLIVLMHAAMR